MSCSAPNSIGSDGKCQKPCNPGQAPFGTANLQCIQNCPPGFMEAEGGCIRPKIPRDKKPFLLCPQGATRINEECWLPCPNGTAADFEVCKPVCPAGFVEGSGGATCEAEFEKRTAVARPACQPNETRLNNLCLSPCRSGMTEFEEDATLCKQKLPADVERYFNTVNFVSAKIVFGRQRTDATCSKGQTTSGNSCQSDCPLNSDVLEDQCVIRCPVGWTQYPNSCARAVSQRTPVGGIGGSFVSSIITVFLFLVIGFFLFTIIASAARRSG